MAKIRAIGGLFMGGRLFGLFTEEFTMEGIGIQLDALASELTADFSGTLTLLSGMGYSKIVFTNCFGHTVKHLRSALKKADLVPVARMVSKSELETNLSGILEEMAELQSRLLICDGIVLDGESAAVKVGEQLEQWASQCAMSGVLFAYRNHSSNFAPNSQGECLLDTLLSTAGDLVQLELDCYLTAKGGHEPVEYLKRYAGRVVGILLQDWKREGDRVTIVPWGQGDAAMSEILKSCDFLGVEYCFVVPVGGEFGGLDDAQAAMERLSDFS